MQTLLVSGWAGQTHCNQARGYTGRLYHKQLLRLDLDSITATTTCTRPRTAATTTTRPQSTGTSTMARRSRSSTAGTRGPSASSVNLREGWYKRSISSLSQQTPLTTQPVLKLNWIYHLHLRAIFISSLNMPYCTVVRIASALVHSAAYLFTRTAAISLTYLLHRCGLITSLVTLCLFTFRKCLRAGNSYTKLLIGRVAGA